MVVLSYVLQQLIERTKMAPSPEAVQLRVLNHVVTFGEDPLEVTISVDTLERMGKLSTGFHTKVGLHPQWVVDHTKGPVDTAVFAVRNCTDTETLSVIARRDKRVNVAKAIIGNGAHDLATCQYLQGLLPLQLYCRIDHNPAPIARVEVVPEEERVAVPDRFATDSFHYFVPSNPLGGLTLSGFPKDATPKEVDGLVTMAMEINALSVMIRIISDYYLDSCPRTVWDSMSFHPVDLLNWLPEQDRTLALRGALSQRQVAANGANPGHLWDHRFVAALIAADAVAEVHVNATRAPRKSLRIFTTKALRLILKTPEWHSVLAVHQPSSREVKLILKALGGDARDLYESADVYSREAIATALAYKGPGALAPRAFQDSPLIYTAKAFTGAADPLFERVLQSMHVETLSEYLLGGTVFGDAVTQHPPLFQIPWFASKINESETAVEALRLRGSLRLSVDAAPARAGDTYLEWSHALIDQVRGAWEPALSSAGIGGVMYRELRECSVSPLDVVRLLSRDGELPALTWTEVRAQLRLGAN
jgi:hypothetical protein